MNYAIDTRTKKRVQADQALKQRGWKATDFICPGCDNPVNLKKGVSRATHFAHLPGYDTDNCPYYLGGESWNWGSQPTPRRAPLPLFLAITNNASRGPIWTLQLGVPRIESPRGRITVVDGITGRTTVSCSSLAREGKRIAVRPQSTPYRVEVSFDIDQEDAERLKEGSPGLSEEAPTLFRSGLKGGRRLPEEESLIWGETYLAIWSVKSPPAFPISVAHQELAKLDATYRGGVFQLPESLELAASDWVAFEFNRRVVTPDVQLRVISPVAMPGEDGELVVDSREEVLIAISAPGGADDLDDIVVIEELTNHLRSLKLDTTGDDVLFASIGAVGMSRLQVRVRDQIGISRAEITICGRQLPLNLAAASVELIDADPNDDRALSVTPLHSRAASRVLEDIRTGDAVLREVRCPAAVECQLATGSTIQTFAPGRSPEQQRDLLSRLSELLVRREAFELDAGAFGSARVEAASNNVVVTPRARSLHFAQRARLRALCSTVNSQYVTNWSVPLESFLAERLTGVAEEYAVADARLIRRFLSAVWTLEVLPQARALARELTGSTQYSAYRSKRIS